jgi:Holliday junction DNA helicase RuvA
MIGYLKGRITEVDDESCIIDVGGVGYVVHCAENILQQLRKETGNDRVVKLITRLIHREDVLDLYGFLRKDEYTLFNMLLRVSGVGPKQALKILGMAETSHIVRAIVTGDNTFLTQLSGIGKKRAEQIIFDLKEKLSRSFDVSHTETSSVYSLAISALGKLGFTSAESREAVDSVMNLRKDHENVSSVVEEALKLLSAGM